MMAISLTQVSMTSGSDKLKLVTPYHPDLPAKARALGGKWNGETKAWYFDPRDSDKVRELTQSIYGVDPLAPVDDLVTVRVALATDPAYTSSYGSSLFALGRELANRPGRDMSARLGQGVIVVSGGFPGSGGSAKYPALNPKPGTVLEVRDVPRALVEKFDTHNATIEIVEDAPVSAVPSVVEQIMALAAQLGPQDRAALIERLQRLQEDRS